MLRQDENGFVSPEEFCKYVASTFELSDERTHLLNAVYETFTTTCALSAYDHYACEGAARVRVRLVLLNC